MADRIEKRAYTAPRVVRLEVSRSGMGSCESPGSGDQFCQNGTTAVGGCNSGDTAGDYCNAGSDGLPF